MNRLVVIVGPTAVGKSAVALSVALRLQGEIISADSVQVYRHLDIGTAKPTAAERLQVPHHLLDLVEPDQDYTVAHFQADAREAIASVHARRRLPLLVGGSGLYVRAVVRNYAFSTAGRDSKLRARLEEEAHRHGTGRLYLRLKSCDPAAAAKIHPNDLRRIIRALEVTEQGSGRFSEQAALTPGPDPHQHVLMFALTMPRDLLYRRIGDRVERMFEQGLVEEVRSLLERGISPTGRALSSLGYRQVVSYLAGEISLEEAKRLIKRDTRRFAKRQLTWFRRDAGLSWHHIAGESELPAAAEKICNILAGYYQAGENT